MHSQAGNSFQQDCQSDRDKKMYYNDYFTSDNDTEYGDFEYSFILSLDV